MKTEAKANKMAFDMYPSISGKSADPVREVVMKYIDYFLPDASGTSAVAIDNKIEQAMDLVKSHLMIAVREEVEVLKEKISELLDKINQLEVENTILKANISQETLQQLQMQTQLQIAGNAGPAAITAGPNSATTNVNIGTTSITNGGSNSTGNNSGTNSTAPTGVATAASTPTSGTGENVVAGTTIINNNVNADADNSSITTTSVTTNGPLS